MPNKAVAKPRSNFHLIFYDVLHYVCLFGIKIQWKFPFQFEHEGPLEVTANGSVTSFTLRSFRHIATIHGYNVLLQVLLIKIIGKCFVENMLLYIFHSERYKLLGLQPRLLTKLELNDCIQNTTAVCNLR